ncbi:MAG: hypothetical protein DRP71_15535 [Verrucomicrobia bacterium]|nr:MAG: hypothetical protein DRP71_15535 [Verrucomicrobiota bacterium]
MTTILAFLAWCVLFILCWPVAIAALLLIPLVWLLALPFRLLGVCVHGLFATLTAIVTLPARLLGWRPA